MADEKQLAILKKGVKAWNEWREKNPNEKPDLRGARLRRTDLRDVNFRRVALFGCNLHGADLYGADLRGADLGAPDLRVADLGRANLYGADLRTANLFEANLVGAYLVMANLSRAELFGANLAEADLRGTYLGRADISWTKLDMVNLNGATFHYTTLADVDLSTVEGLESVKHDGPSMVGIGTIYKSRGRIPEVFLRGCGVPENMITFMHSLVGTAIEFYSCFICYSSKDDALAKQLYVDLQDKGVRVWFAPEDLKIGDKFRSRIDEAIHIYDKLLIVLSKNSINSPWVRREVQTALAKEKKEKRTALFPIRLDDTFLKTTEDWADDIRRNRHVGDFKKWNDQDSYQKAFDRLLKDLHASESS